MILISEAIAASSFSLPSPVIDDKISYGAILIGVGTLGGWLIMFVGMKFKLDNLTSIMGEFKDFNKDVITRLVKLETIVALNTDKIISADQRFHDLEMKLYYSDLSKRAGNLPILANEKIIGGTRE